jgi:ceramide glucosyltransferase
MALIHPLVSILAFGSLAVTAAYSLLTVIAVLAWRTQRVRGTLGDLPQVTVLKPLCGSEPRLYEHLRSFFEQDYAQFQIVFGARDRNDPACAVVRRLAAEFPGVPVEVVINPQLHGGNCKISNLMNMLPLARHDLLVMADSDAFVGRDYLRSVTAPLLDAEVGLVTCIYRGVAAPGICSRLGAMYINEWYVPSVLLTWLFGYRGYVSGQTMCIRRDTLRAIGGFEAIVDHIADDYRIGELVRGLGLRIVLSPYEVMGQHHEPSLASLIRHELRWMRTIRVLRPRSFLGMFLTFSLPLAILGTLMASGEPSLSTAAWGLLGVTVAARLSLHFVHRLRGAEPLLSDLWLLPVRDLLICWVWCRSLFISRVTWRGNEFDVDAEGLIRRPS